MAHLTINKVDSIKVIEKYIFNDFPTKYLYSHIKRLILFSKKCHHSITQH